MQGQPRLDEADHRADLEVDLASLLAGQFDAELSPVVCDLVIAAQRVAQHERVHARRQPARRRSPRVQPCLAGQLTAGDRLVVLPTTMAAQPEPVTRKDVLRGVAIDEPGGIGVTIFDAARDPEGRVVGWRSGSATNWGFRQILTVSAVCTNNPAGSYQA